MSITPNNQLLEPHCTNAQECPTKRVGCVCAYIHVYVCVYVCVRVCVWGWVAMWVNVSETERHRIKISCCTHSTGFSSGFPKCLNPVQPIHPLLGISDWQSSWKPPWPIFRSYQRLWSFQPWTGQSTASCAFPTASNSTVLLSWNVQLHFSQTLSK